MIILIKIFDLRLHELFFEYGIRLEVQTGSQNGRIEKEPFDYFLVSRAEYLGFIHKAIKLVLRREQRQFLKVNFLDFLNHLFSICL